VKLSYLKENPFRNYKAKSEPTNRQYLTYEEVQRIEKLDLSGNTKLEEARDMFLFYVYTSISYSDAKSLTKENVQLSISGKKFIIYQRNKTGVSATVPMLDTTETLLNKFAKSPAVVYSGTLLYQYSNQHINRCLTDIAKLAEINKPLTCHVGRQRLPKYMAVSQTGRLNQTMLT
jgi:integrase